MEGSDTAEGTVKGRVVEDEHWIDEEGGGMEVGMDVQTDHQPFGRDCHGKRVSLSNRNLRRTGHR